MRRGKKGQCGNENAAPHALSADITSDDAAWKYERSCGKAFYRAVAIDSSRFDLN